MKMMNFDDINMGTKFHMDIYMDRNNKCDKIRMDENLHMEWYGPYKWLCKIISFLFYTN